MLYSAEYISPIGPLTLAGDGESLVGLWMQGQKYFGGSVSEEMTQGKEIPALKKAAEWLDRYFAGERPAINELTLRPKGSEFRQKVWTILCEIPYGQVTTYGQIAKQLAVQMKKETLSAQAVGGAVGHNPISIIIPCHRVIGANRSLTGYAGGIEKKIKLLKLEGADPAQFTVPQRGTAL